MRREGGGMGEGGGGTRDEVGVEKVCISHVLKTLVYTTLSCCLLLPC